MAGQESQTQTAGMDAEQSMTVRVTRKSGVLDLESLFVTFTTKFEVEIDLDHPLIRDEIDRIVGEDGLPSAFARLLALGDLAADPKIVYRPDSEFSTLGSPERPLHITVNDAKGQPIRPINRQESEVEWERKKAAQMRARFLAILVDATLVRIGSRYRQELDTVSSVFRAQFISDRDAEIFGRALRYYWEGHYDDAARVALPSIEAVIRSIVQAIRGSSYVEPKAGRDGYESTLGRLISMLDPNLPELFRWELEVILTDPLGLNLRNTHLHGLADPEPKHDAAIILYTAGQLTLIHSENTASTGS